MSKVIAFYLPQFHSIPENDKWWGEGFTEWTNVKRATPVIRGEVQPKIPLNKNYYNLLDRKTVEWQTELMKKYNIYGFCYYHYWFGEKMLLQKPAENLLKWKDIDQPFCFDWVNGSWVRTWSAVNATKWSNYDVKEDGDTSDGMLAKQEYGGPKHWEEHYHYLSDFFKDTRYIKIDDKPIMLIHHLHDIACRDEMFLMWNKLAKEDGFDGIELLAVGNGVYDEDYVAGMVQYLGFDKFERHFWRNAINNTINNRLNIKSLSLPNIYNYQKVWNGMTIEHALCDKLFYPGGVVNYNDTPRRGRRGLWIAKSDASLYERYLTKQLKRANSVGAEYVFMSAWNEWAEGNYLEPDEENGYSYLEANKRAVEKQ